MGEKEGKGDKDKEKKGGGGGDGGEKKKDGGKKNQEEGGAGPIELKVDMHCEGCAHKVKKAVRGLEGVEKVSVDSSNNKLKVVGKVDPWKLKEFVEAKTRKKVDFISPKDPPKKKDDANKPAAADEKKSDDKKPKTPPVSTVVLKIRLHCVGCIDRIKRTIRKVKGVEDVTVDDAKDLVTVKGTMDVKTLPEILKVKIRRGVEIIQPKKDEKKEKGGDGGGEKKEKGGDGGGEKKEKGGDGGGGGGKKDKGGDGGGGGEKKVKGRDGGGDGEKKEDAGDKVAAASSANKMDYFGGYSGGHGPYGDYGYRIEMVHAPQIFSDENPNACSIM